MADLFISTTGITVEANLLTSEMAEAVASWCNGVHVVEHDALDHNHVYAGINVPTCFGMQRASEGDWIIKLVTGEFIPVKPLRFAELFEPLK